MTSSEGYIWNITIIDYKWMEKWSDVNPLQMTSTLMLVKLEINPGDRVVFLYIDFIEFPIIGAKETF